MRALAMETEESWVGRGGTVGRRFSGASDRRRGSLRDFRESEEKESRSTDPRHATALGGLPP